MAATNRTDNYNLPIFISSDIPTWLGDWNATMRSLDAAIKTIDTLATNLGTTKANASDVYTKNQVDTILQGYAGSPIVKQVKLLSNGWVRSGDLFLQTISVDGLLASDIPFCQAVCDDATDAEAWNAIIKAIATTNTLTFAATEAPSVTLDIQVVIIR